MDDAARHLLYLAAQDRSLPFVAKLSANSAHCEPRPLPWENLQVRFETGENTDCETVAPAPSDAWELCPSRGTIAGFGRSRRAFAKPSEPHSARHLRACRVFRSGP